MSNLKRIKGASPVFRLKDSPSKEKPIRLDYSYGRGKRFRYGVGYSVNPDFWNKETGRVKNVNAARHAAQLNKLLRDLSARLEDFVADCDTKQIQITNQMMKAHLDKFRNIIDPKGNDEKNVVTSLTDFIEKFIRQKERELPKQRNGYKNGTVKSYEQTLGHLRQFEEEFEYVLGFDLDYEFYSEFIEYMSSKTYVYNKKKKYYSLNTIGKQIKNLRVFMGAALENELHSNLKYKKFKVLVEITTAIYLDLEDLKKLYELDLGETPHLGLARDVFVIGCEIGQRISDYHDLSGQPIIEHSGERFIKIRQEKTGKEVLCKITPVIEKIMDEKYNGGLPPKIAEQKLNNYIKIVGEKAGIDTLIKNEITRGGKRTTEYTPKHKLIMGHTARRTFCTLKYKAGMDVHSIMELSGHTTIKEFMKYIRNPKEERVSQITSTKAFIESCIEV